MSLGHQPGSGRWWLCGLLSLSLHGVLLLIPLPAPSPKPRVPRLVKLIYLPSPTPSPLPSPISFLPPSPTPTSTGFPAATPSLSPSLSPSPTPTSTGSPIATPSLSPQPSSSPVQPTPKISPTPTPSPKPSQPEPPSLIQVQTAFVTAIDQVTQNYGDQASDLSGIFAASPETFIEQPDRFYKDGKPLPGFSGKTLQVNQAMPAQVFSVYAPLLQKAGFVVSPLPNYGGGLLYEVKQGSVVYYLNLLLLTDKSGTLVVVWNMRPGRN